MSERCHGDPHGHRLLRQRVTAAEETLMALAANPAPDLQPFGTKNWEAGGLGSSEAHARYFSELVHSSADFHARYRLPTEDPTASTPDTGWIFFTQGFSDNAMALTRHWEEAGDRPRLLVTASTPEQLLRSGHEERARQLENLLASGVVLFPMPGAGEYTLLIRTIGPLCGYWVALQLAFRLGLVPVLPEAARLQETRESAETLFGQAGEALTEEWIRGAALNTCGPLGGCAQNLLLKRLEGLYREPSPCRDLFSYAHGYFQVDSLQRRPQWFLGSRTVQGHPLVTRFHAMNQVAGIASRSVLAPEAFPLDVFFYEMLFNRILCAGVEALGIDQVQWPGKGQDGPLYAWNLGGMQIE